MRLCIETGPDGVRVTDPETGETIEGVLGVNIDLEEGRAILALTLSGLDLTIRPAAPPVAPRPLGFVPPLS